MDIKITIQQALERERAGKRADPCKNFYKGRTLGKSAEIIGTSHVTLHKVKTIAERKPELIAR